MRNPFRTLMLCTALALTPACASPRLEAPIAAAETLDQRAYALLSTYAALLEEAADIAADPATPRGVVRALAQAEAKASPAIEALGEAAAAYVRAGEDAEAQARLARALGEAQAPIAALQSLVRP